MKRWMLVCGSVLALTTVSFSVAAQEFRRADANQDGGVDLGDVVAMLDGILRPTVAIRCEDASDVNDDGMVDVTDAAYLLTFLFLGGEPPDAPFATCGLDPTPDDLGCRAFGECGSVAAFGVIASRGFACAAFETDEGEIYALTELGEFVAGDRVFVEGRVRANVAAACGSILVPRLENTIVAAFAGVGRVLSGANDARVLQTNDGDRYELLEEPQVPPGFQGDVFLQGVAVRTGPGRVSVGGVARGPAFAGFGRLRWSGAWSLETSARTFRLDRVGAPDVVDGAFVFVEGWIDERAGAPRLRDNTARPALELGGEIVELGGERWFRAEHQLFNDLYRLPRLPELPVGEERFVRGRGLSDFDPLEARVDRFIRSAKIDALVSRCGELVSLEPPVCLLDDGSEFILENSGEFLLGRFVFVSGARRGNEAVLEHNTIHPCVSLRGELVQGFECTPLFAADTPVGPENDVFVVEHLGGREVGDRFCVRGALTACESLCPFPCVSGNVVFDCAGEEVIVDDVPNGVFYRSGER